ncbi:MAG: amidohydrolase [Eubacteriales bacterium]|nr:amidohydrolase [Eubacteriales bacterium]
MLKIDNVKIYTMEKETGVIDCGYVIVDAGKIAEIGRSDGDGSGGWLFPGFIDAHTHLGLIGDSLTFEGDDVNEASDSVTPHLRGLDGINPLDRCFAEARESGVTCVASGPGSANPIGGQSSVLKTIGVRIDSMTIRQPAAIKFAMGENPKNVYHVKNQTPETRMAIAALIRENLFKAKKYSEAMIKAQTPSAAQEDDGDEEPEYDMKMEALLPLVRGEIPAHFHAHRADDIFTAIRIAKEFGLNYAIVHCTEGYLIADELKKEGVSAIVGPNLIDRSKPELASLSFANPARLSQAGVTVAITTDHPVIPLQYLGLCASLAVKAGMDAHEALRAITINPARILGINHRTGSVKAGKDADLVLFDGNPLEIMTAVKQVYIDGSPVK